MVKKLFKYQIKKYEGQLINTRKAATYFNIKYETIYKWYQRKKIIPFGTIKSQNVYFIKYLENFINNQKNGNRNVSGKLWNLKQM